MAHDLVGESLYPPRHQAPLRPPGTWATRRRTGPYTALHTMDAAPTTTTSSAGHDDDVGGHLSHDNSTGGDMKFLRDGADTLGRAAHRYTRMQCCGTFALIVLTLTTLVIAVFLAQDGTKLNRIVADFERLHVFDTVAQVQGNVTDVWMPRVTQILARTDRLTEQAETWADAADRARLAQELVDFAQESRAWMQHINRTIMQTTLHFNIDLNP